MQEAINKILHYTAGFSADTFRADERTVDAIVWNLTVLGEATRHIPEEVVQAYPEVPWPQMRGIRNRIMHGYDEINVDIIWNVVCNELPPLLPVLQRINTEATE